MSQRIKVSFFIDIEFYELFQKILKTKDEKLQQIMFGLMRNYVDLNIKHLEKAERDGDD